MKSLNVTFDELKNVVRDNEKQRFTLLRDPTTISSSTRLDQDGNDDDVDGPRYYIVRAAQGHSIVIDHSLLLTELTLKTAPTMAVHGTFRKTWPRIVASGGLKPMGRTLIHFSPVSSTDPPPILTDIKDQDQPVEGMHPPNKLKPGDPTTNDDNDDDNNHDESSLGQKRKAEERNKIVFGMRASATVYIYVDLHRSLQSEDEGGAGIKWWRSDNGVLLTEGYADTGIFPRHLFVRVVDIATGTELWKDGRAIGV